MPDDVRVALDRDLARAARAVKEGVANDHQQQLFYHYVVAPIYDFGYVAGRDDAVALAWREGRRSRALEVHIHAETPVPDEPEPKLPPARTITERAARRMSPDVT